MVGPTILAQRLSLSDLADLLATIILSPIVLYQLIGSVIARGYGGRQVMGKRTRSLILFIIIVIAVLAFAIMALHLATKDEGSHDYETTTILMM